MSGKVLCARDMAIPVDNAGSPSSFGIMSHVLHLKELAGTQDQVAALHVNAAACNAERGVPVM